MTVSEWVLGIGPGLDTHLNGDGPDGDPSLSYLLRGFGAGVEVLESEVPRAGWQCG